MTLSAAQQKAIGAKLREIADIFDPPAKPTPTPAPAPTPAPTTAKPLGGTGSWKTIFEDTFTGSMLDLTKWRQGFHWAAAGNHHGAQFDPHDRAHSELQWYAPSQATITADGKLQLKAERQTYTPTDPAEGGPFSYISGVVTTAPDTYGVTVGDAGGWKPQPPTFDFLYGWAEAVIRVPRGQGFWPAFWMIPTDLSWPPEIDVLETLGHQPNIANMHYHYGSSNTDFGNAVVTSTDLTSDFHTYGVNWSADSIDWYIDGKLVQSFTDKANISNKRMYLLLNLAVGGKWPGAPDSTTSFPATMLVDRVSVFARQP